MKIESTHPFRRPRAWLLVLFLLACVLGSNAPPRPGPEPDRGEQPTNQSPVSLLCPTYDPATSPLPADLAPSDTAAAGTLQGSFAVSQIGEATYSIPLVVPPGRAGMEPSLAITYGSSGGEGFLGVGFGISGLSAISRCPSNLAQDGIIRPVRHDDADNLCLDGARLVLTGGGFAFDGSGTREYRTIPDTFAKIVAHFGPGQHLERGPEWFEVFSKSGRIAQYGSHESARVMATNQVVSAWWLSEEHDRRNNEIVYQYSNARATGDGRTLEIVPSRIEYAHRADNLPSRVVRLVTTDAATPVKYWSGGMKLRRTKLLSRVEMTTAPGDLVVRSYRLDYEPGEGTKRPLLRDVRECAGSSGPCKPETRFGWSSHAGATLALSVKKLIADRSYGDKDRETWLLADVNGDGLEDFVMSHPRVGKASIDEWWVGLNTGGDFATPVLWKSFSYPGERGPWVATPIDYDQDGLTDILLDSRFESWPTYRWLHANPNHTFDLRDTGVPRPAIDDVDDDHLDNYRFMRLGDVNGDGVADLIQCVNPGYGDEEVAATRHWTVNFWSPSLPGGPGFEPTAMTIPIIDGVVDCGWGKRSIYVADTSGDGAADLVVPFTGGTYGAIRHVAGDQWKSEPLNLLRDVSRPYTSLHFLDANGDGLSDVIMTGLGHHGCGGGSASLGTICGEPPPSKGSSSLDLPFRSDNKGGTFADIAPTLPGQLATNFWTDALGAASVPMDFNGDGRMDLLMPVREHCGDGSEDPCWVVLRSSLGGEGMMTPIDTHIRAVTNSHGLAVREGHVPRVTDVDGDGRQDLVVRHPYDWTRFSIYKSDGPQDLLLSIADGMSPLGSSEPGFVPAVEIQYGNLVDRSVTEDIAPSSLTYADQTYLAHADPANGCAYPRACVVGPARVVKGYQLNNGKNQRRSFAVMYRDGRYHHRGRGFLGFGERIEYDVDTAAGTAEFYDNITHDPAWDSYPFTGQVVRSWAWSTEKPHRLDPGRVSITFTERTLLQEDTNAGQSYLTMPTRTLTTREEGTMTPEPGKSVLHFVATAAESPLTVLGEAWDQVVVHDEYGNATVELHDVTGADLTTNVTRIYDNDPATWLVGQLRHEQVCSSAFSRTQCRATDLDYNDRGEVSRVSSGDPADPGTQLAFAFAHDRYGHVTRATAHDEFGHHRAACVSYDADGIFPYAVRNALGHTTYTKRDAGLGVLTSAVDAGGLVTRWRHDAFGRVTEEKRPDGTTTTVAIARKKDGGPQASWWSVLVRTEESDGPASTTELDSLGRAVRSWTLAAEVKTCGASVCKPALLLEQETTYDFLGRVARVTVPWMAGDTLTGKHHHDYDYDASGRLIRHTEPWGRVTTFKHTGLVTSATDGLGTTETQTDALGRVVRAVDNKGYATQTLYGPFGARWATMRVAGETTISERDAYGRVIRELDPDRGETQTSYDGFGEALTVDDAAGRHYEFAYDAIGRLVGRDDPDGQTIWDYDDVGRLASVTNPSSVKQYTYDSLSRPASIALSVGDDTFSATFGYDPQGRLSQITYPHPPGVAPLVVVRDHDAHGNVVAVRDKSASAGAEPFWKLARLDGAGRTTEESFENGVRATREIDPESGMVKRIQAIRGLTKLQDLAYAYDTGLRMKSRADRMQVGKKGVRTELFTHDALGRLTCSRFADVPVGQAASKGPCALTVQYSPTGNINYKSDVGAYTYDPAHPHAVKTAGGSVFGYDAVGNQTERPSEDIEYTAFDLPRIVYTAAGDLAMELGYDGDQQRILKRTPEQDTVYFEGLYERIAEPSVGKAWHRYYVAAGSATLVITRHPGQANDGIAYLHTEALGSTDMVTSGTGAVLQRKSHDAFGARRNPKWGAPWVGAPASKGAPLGFTGHEEDEELGLVNMRGRIYDPKLGRFLQTDPIVSAPHFGQSWNAYSYVMNSPLNFVDPSGFQAAPPYGKLEGEDKVEYARLPYDQVNARPLGVIPRQELRSEGAEPKNASRDDAASAAGSRAPAAAQQGPAEREPPDDWRQTGAARGGREFARGVLGGLAPLGVNVDELASKSGILPRGTRNERLARHLGQLTGGMVQQLVGFTVAIHGGAVGVGSGGTGSAVAVGEIAGGVTIAVAGAWNVSQAWQALLSTGSGSSGVPKVKLPSEKYPETAAHVRDAQAAGKSKVVTIDRPGIPNRRPAALAGRAKVPGKQLDEYPPAMFKEGGAGASVRPVSPRDNMGAGACIGNQCRGFPDGTKVEIVVE